jgi:hypothetical protein
MILMLYGSGTANKMVMMFLKAWSRVRAHVFAFSDKIENGGASKARSGVDKFTVLFSK